MAKIRKTKRKPLIIAIHGEGIDVDMNLAGSPNLSDALAEIFTKLQERPQPITKAKAPTEADLPENFPNEPHHFDVVQTVIKHADNKVLEAIITLTKAELEQRAAHS